MKIHSDGYKRQIKLIGKEIDSKITYGNTVLGKDDLNTVTPNYQGGILTSVMKQLDIDSNVEIPVGTILKYEFGVKVNEVYEYIDYGNYIVHKVEKQEDTHSYLITCYDKMLYAMVDYKKDGITYPTTIRNYLKAICNKLGLMFANEIQEFANYDKVIESDLYDGLDYTYRDVLDDIAQVTASTICINNDDEIEVRYINDTGDTIDEEFLKDVNVNFGKKYGPINSIVLSRSAESDNVYLQNEESVAQNGLNELKIINNQIMNFNNRADYLPEILGELNGLEYYINDFTSTGITYYDLCDRYNVKIGDNIYSCVMFNNEVDVTQGLQELVYTEMPKETETDYKKADKTDRKINQTYIIVDKQNQTINALASSVSEIKTEVVPTGQASGSNIHISDSADAELLDFKLYGKSTQETRSGRNLFNYEDVKSVINGESADDKGWITMTYDNSTGTSSHYSNWWTSKVQTLKPSTQYLIITEIKEVSGAGTLSVVSSHSACQFGNGKSYKFTDVSSNSIHSVILTTRADFTNTSYMLRTFATFNAGQSGSITFRISVLEDTSITTDNFEYEAYGVMPSPDYPSEIESVGYENLFDKNNYNLYNGYFNNNTITANAGNDIFYIDCKPNTTYNVSKTPSINYAIAYSTVLPTANTTLYGRISANNQASATITTGNDAKYLVIWARNGNIGGEITRQQVLDTMQITKGTQQHSYIPYGKYGIEVNINNENLFNYEDTYQVTGGITTDDEGWITITYDNTNGTSTKFFNYYTNPSSVLKTNTNYKLITEIKEVSGTGILFSASSTATSQINNGTSYSLDTLNTNDIKIATFTTKSDFSSCTNMIRTYIQFRAGESGSITFRISVLADTPIIADNFIYKPYKLTPTLIQSDYPLMSNKDETIRDYLYLQNGNLYLRKNIGQLDLPNNIGGYNASNNWYYIGLSSLNISVGSISLLSNYFTVYNHNTFVDDTTLEGICLNSSDYTKATHLLIRIKGLTSQTEYRTWFAENIVKVQYELAEPQDILIAENVDSLITYKNVTNISTTDNLQPNMEVTYIRDNTLNGVYQTQNDMNKYYTKVENDAQLEIVSDEIKSSVTEINTTIDTIRGAIETINQTMLTQTADQFEMLFKQTGIKELVDSVDALTKSNNATLVEQEQWIRFKGGNIELGRSDSQVKLLLSNDRISFLTGGNESAYISNNQLYITDSTILNKLQVGHWETIEEDGNLNTRWIEGVI